MLVLLSSKYLKSLGAITGANAMAEIYYRSLNSATSCQWT